MTSHSIAEFDDLRMLSDLGYDTFSIGAYTDPFNPTDDKRPALDTAYFPDLAALCDEQRHKHRDDDASWVIDWAKGDLHPELIEWADAIIVHHFPQAWIVAQWEAIRHKRVIWRTCGQSSPDGSLEAVMAHLHGLEIVRYSPKERSIPNFAGESALIRFGKYPDDYLTWTGETFAVGNITQNMAQRGDACGYGFWAAATNGLPTQPAGPGSEAIGGLGALSYTDMQAYLSQIRCYLYTGTQPASYTLGLIEAMFAGVPLVSIGANAFGLPDLFEGHELAAWASDQPTQVASDLGQILSDDDTAWLLSMQGRARAKKLFGIDTIGPQWKALLG